MTNGNGAGVEQTVRAVMADILGVAPERMDDASAETWEAWDSANHLRLMLALEAEFGIRIAVEEMEEADSFPAVVALVRARTGSR